MTILILIAIGLLLMLAAALEVTSLLKGILSELTDLARLMDKMHTQQVSCTEHLERIEDHLDPEVEEATPDIVAVRAARALRTLQGDLPNS